MSGRSPDSRHAEPAFDTGRGLERVMSEQERSPTKLFDGRRTGSLSGSRPERSYDRPVFPSLQETASDRRQEQQYSSNQRDRRDWVLHGTSTFSRPLVEEVVGDLLGSSARVRSDKSKVSTSAVIDEVPV